MDKILVFSFFACIELFIIFSAYYRYGIKPILIIAAIALIIISFREKNSRVVSFLRYFFSSKYAAFVLFAFAVLVSTILSKDLKHSKGIFFERYSLYFIVFGIGRYIFINKTVARILNESFGINIFEAVKYIFISAGLLIGLGGIIDYIRFHPGRLFSVFGHEIQFLMLPLYIIYFLPVIYCFIFQGNTFLQRTFSFVTFAMLVLCLIFTGSRSAWIAGFISVLFATILINKRLLRYLVPGFFVCIFLIYFFMRIRMIDYGTYFYRKDIMLAAIGIFRDNVLWGAGPGMYEKLVYNYSKGPVFIHAHCMYLEILAELGIIGLIFFLSIFINFYLRVFKNFSKFNGLSNKFLYVGLLASNVASLVFALFGSIILVGFHDAPLFWLIFGMGFGLENYLSLQNLNKEAVQDGV